jgi:hypothetical protein
LACQIRQAVGAANLLFLVTCERYLEVPAVNGSIDYPDKRILQALLPLAAFLHLIVRILERNANCWDIKNEKRDALLALSVPHFSDGLNRASLDLLDFDFCAGCFDLLLDVFSLLLGDTFLDRLGRAFD